MSVEAELFDDRLADADRLVGEHGHRDAGGEEAVERLANAGVELGVVELVLAVVAEEEGQGLIDVLGGAEIAKRPLDQHGRAVADVLIDGLVLERIPAHEGERGIDRVRQIEARIDQRAIQIEDEQRHLRGLAPWPRDGCA